MFRFLGFGFGQLGTGGFDQGREVVAVVDILDIEVGLGAIVGRTHILDAQQLAPCLGGFDIEAVVAYETEGLTSTVDTIVTEHLASFNIACARALFDYILHKIWIACHRR